MCTHSRALFISSGPIEENEIKINIFAFSHVSERKPRKILMYLTGFKFQYTYIRRGVSQLSSRKPTFLCCCAIIRFLHPRADADNTVKRATASLWITDRLTDWELYMCEGTSLSRPALLLTCVCNYEFVNGVPDGFSITTHTHKRIFIMESVNYLLRQFAEDRNRIIRLAGSVRF
jgi:hypothetical protein